MLRSSRGKKTALLAGCGVLVLAVLGGLERERLLEWYRFVRDFERLDSDAEGRPRYRHRQTGLAFTRVRDGALEPDVRGTLELALEAARGAEDGIQKKMALEEIAGRLDGALWAKFISERKEGDRGAPVRLGRPPGGSVYLARCRYSPALARTFEVSATTVLTASAFSSPLPKAWLTWTSRFLPTHMMTATSASFETL